MKKKKNVIQFKSNKIVAKFKKLCWCLELILKRINNKKIFK